MTDQIEPIVQLDRVRYTWPGTSAPVISIDQFNIARGKRVFLRGPSGSGKTTLLSLISAVLSPQAGTVSVDGISLDTLRGGQRDQFRVDHIGLVFQQFNLLPFLSVRENILLPCKFSGHRRSEACQAGNTLVEESDRLLRAMNLQPADIQSKRVTDLSVGQQQRVAVARALIGRPPLIIADEPTSALDSDTREAFLKLLFAEVDAARCTLLFVSHDSTLSQSFDEVIDLQEINTAIDESQLPGVLR